jgi:hypothetical protein
LNHFAIAFDTVVPAISQPQPKIIKPRHDILAVPGSAVHHEFIQVSSEEPMNRSLIP